ncbi:immunoglobulin lambda-1 light chain-like [Bufo bufo]|uniref:immunoglobulin lambda-1 light chain-like n=1 Tax=Bufo bufo TaxID=8384 RepID=UPI001ABDC9AC|nr:immunoglobulin lambda-1 light chain-like [Bufo bufo]
MLYPCILVALFLSVDAQTTVDQELPSLVKVRGDRSTARIPCEIRQQTSFVHWYVQKQNQVIKRILYFGEGKDIYEDGFDSSKYDTTPRKNKYTLTIYDVKDDDSGIYYCAYWGKLHSVDVKVFGSGTKLVVTYQEAKEPHVTILASSKSDLRTKKSATLLCNLQNFFPDAIKVEWSDGSNNKLESEQGKIITNASSDLSSLYSWITIKQSDIGSTYKCKYKHEGNGNQWKEETYNTEHLNVEDLMDQADQTDISNCIYTPGNYIWTN